MIQTTEADEFVPRDDGSRAVEHASQPTKVLIIGGGDGGILREVLKHPTVESVTQVEIDRAVVDICIEYFPKHSDGAFSDPRLSLVIDDGAHLSPITKHNSTSLSRIRLTQSALAKFFSNPTFTKGVPEH